MIAIQINHVKTFMNHLLIQETFDRFMVNEASITTFTTFSIDGSIHTEFYKNEDDISVVPERPYVLWREIKGFCLSVIKGKRTPLSFKFVFQLTKEDTEQLLSRIDSPFSVDDVFGLYLNCQFHDNSLILTSGISLKVFSMDKSLDKEWDRALLSFLDRHDLTYNQNL